MEKQRHKSLIVKILEILEQRRIDELDELWVVEVKAGVTHSIVEGKWVQTGKTLSIRIDNPTYGAGQVHAHIIGKKNDELGVVNLDGTGSHGTRMTLSRKAATTLTQHGFQIRPDRIVEWIGDPALSVQFLNE